MLTTTQPITLPLAHARGVIKKIVIIIVLSASDNNSFHNILPSTPDLKIGCFHNKLIILLSIYHQGLMPSVSYTYMYITDYMCTYFGGRRV